MYYRYPAASIYDENVIRSVFKQISKGNYNLVLDLVFRPQTKHVPHFKIDFGK